MEIWLPSSLWLVLLVLLVLLHFHGAHFPVWVRGRGWVDDMGLLRRGIVALRLRRLMHMDGLSLHDHALVGVGRSVLLLVLLVLVLLLLGGGVLVVALWWVGRWKGREERMSGWMMVVVGMERLGLEEWETERRESVRWDNAENSRRPSAEDTPSRERARDLVGEVESGRNNGERRNPLKE